MSANRRNLRRSRQTNVDRVPVFDEIVILEEPVTLSRTTNTEPVRLIEANSAFLADIDAIMAEEQSENSQRINPTSRLGRLPPRVANRQPLHQRPQQDVVISSSTNRTTNRSRRVESALNSLIWLNDLMLDEIIEMRQEFKHHADQLRSSLERQNNLFRRDLINELPKKFASQLKEVIFNDSSLKSPTKKKQNESIIDTCQTTSSSNNITENQTAQSSRAPQTSPSQKLLKNPPKE